MTKFSIENTKTQQKCESCSEKIKAKSVLISTKKGKKTPFYHSECAFKLKEFQGGKLDLEDIEGYEDLSKKDQKAVLELYAKNQNKKDNDQESDEEEEVSKKKKGKNGKKAEEKKSNKKQSSKSPQGYTNDEYAKYLQYKEELKSKNMDYLKALLKKNQQVQSGTKDELIERVADRKTLGSIPNCTKCGGGKLRFDMLKGEYFCKGYMEDTTFKFCKARFARNEVTRFDFTE